MSTTTTDDLYRQLGLDSLITVNGSQETMTESVDASPPLPTEQTQTQQPTPAEALSGRDKEALAHTAKAVSGALKTAGKALLEASAALEVLASHWEGPSVLKPQGPSPAPPVTSLTPLLPATVQQMTPPDVVPTSPRGLFQPKMPAVQVTPRSLPQEDDTDMGDYLGLNVLEHEMEARLPEEQDEQEVRPEE